MRRIFSATFVILSLIAHPVLATVRHVPGQYATIQVAIDAAVVGDIVEVACGTYQTPELIMKTGITMRSATGQADCVVVTPNQPYTPLLMCNVGENTLIEGITFLNGNDSGGGAIVFGGSPALSRCKFVSNRGMFVRSTISTSALGSCGYSGAAIIFDDARAVVTDCEFTDNASSAGGIRACGSNEFVNCLFNGNYGSEGSWGAIATEGGTFSDCVFRDNHGYFSGGAANCYDATFLRCLFEANWTGISAGAVYARASSFQECWFFENWTGVLAYGTDAIGGGALYIWGNEPSAIVDCTFWGNDASLPRAVKSRASLAAISYGSAVWVGSSALTITGSIMSGNKGSEAVSCGLGAAVNISCSNIFGNPGGDWVGCVASQFGLKGNISADPMFCDAQNGDFHLSSLSPCLYAECGAMGAFGQGCLDDKPALFRVSDVGNDQGRQVRLTWQRSAHDSPTANPYVVGYAVYRKKDQFAKEPPVAQMARGEGVAILGWDYLGTVPSRGDSIYETVVPTLCDSTIADGQCLSTFFLSAMTPNPFVFYDSPQLAGYSLDNLAPPTPTGLAVAYNTGSGNHLEWDAVAAGDFAGFHVYRDAPPGNFATSGTLVATTTQTSWTDPDFDGWNVGYEVTSFDGAGNESAPAVGGTTTDVPAVTLHRLELLPNVPNPFNPSTRIPFTTPSEGPVRIAIYDTRGSLVRVLVDKSFPAGHHGAVWDGRDAKGSPVSSGIYLCRLEHRSDVRTRKIVLIK